MELVKESGLTEYTTRCLQAALADHHYAASSESQVIVDCRLLMKRHWRS